MSIHELNPDDSVGTVVGAHSGFIFTKSLMSTVTCAVDQEHKRGGGERERRRKERERARDREREGGWEGGRGEKVDGTGREGGEGARRDKQKRMTTQESTNIRFSSAALVCAVSSG